MARTHQAFGGIDILVANCGGPPRGGLWEMTDDQWYGAFDVSVLSVVRLIREVVPSMRERKWGRILTIQSTSVKQPVEGLLLSNAVRPGVAGLAKTLAPELGKDNITINLVLPGRIMTDRFLSGARQAGVPREDYLKKASTDIPLGRVGSPEEFANVLVFLASERVSYVTGVTLQVDGGVVRGQFRGAVGSHKHSGAAVCPNNLWLPLDAADRGILDAIERDLLTSEILDAALEEALAGLLPTSERAEQRRESLVAEHSRLEAELGRLTEAIVAGGDAATLVAAIRTREKRRADVVAALATLGQVRQMDAHQLTALRADFRERLSDWRSLLRRQPIQGRQILRKLLVGRLTLTPAEADGRRVYEYRGEATLGRLLAGAVPSALGMVTPAGFEPAISTLKGSRPGPG